MISVRKPRLSAHPGAWPHVGHAHDAKAMYAVVSCMDYLRRWLGEHSRRFAGQGVGGTSRGTILRSLVHVYVALAHRPDDST
eukprot:scaffold276336_cov40-Tisochrysis_lutea.AAC.1